MGSLNFEIFIKPFQNFSHLLSPNPLMCPSLFSFNLMPSFFICRSARKHQEWKSNALREARRKSGLTRFSSWCWFKLWKYYTRKVILGLYEYLEKGFLVWHSPSCTMRHNYIEAPLKESVTSSMKMGSIDKLFVLS